MEIKVQLVIMSHLSDIQEDPNNKDNNLKINFIKYLIGSYPNLTDTIDVDKVCAHFLSKHSKFYQTFKINLDN